VKTEYVKMEDVGLTGNEHEMMLDKIATEIAKFFVTGSTSMCTSLRF